MTRVFTPGQPGKPGRAGRAMNVTAATVLIAVWAILLVALRAGSPHWLNLHIVGIILVLAGVLAVAVPRLAASWGAWYRRWVMALMSRRYPAPRAADELIRMPGASGDTPALADDLPRREHDPQRR
jgi:hypothetical protein